MERRRGSWCFPKKKQKNPPHDTKIDRRHRVKMAASVSGEVFFTVKSRQWVEALIHGLGEKCRMANQTLLSVFLQCPGLKGVPPLPVEALKSVCVFASNATWHRTHMRQLKTSPLPSCLLAGAKTLTPARPHLMGWG